MSSNNVFERGRAMKPCIAQREGKRLPSHGWRHMEREIIICRAIFDDKAPIWAIRTRAIAEIRGNYYSGKELKRWSGVPMPGQFDETIRSKVFLVVEIDDVIVEHGFLDKKTGEIDAVFVDPNSQRRGVRTQLLIALEKIARDSGLEFLHLSTTLNSVEFYKAAGFKELKVSQYQHPKNAPILIQMNVRGRRTSNCRKNQ